MSATPRAATAKVVVTYWALILFGLAIFTVQRLDTLAPIGPLCAGTLLGTAMGQILAWRRFRMWIAAVIVIALGLAVLPGLRDELQGKSLWLSFLPAALCGYWSLGDRTSLASFWFPAMIWMLSILDRVESHALPGGTGLALFVSLVAMFFVFLRVREERRISQWRTVAPSPLAVVKPPVILQQAAGVEIARGVWGLVAATMALGVTAWIAPMLWAPETLDAGTEAVADTQVGLPCCPKADQVPITHARVKEYLDLDRGVDHAGAPIPGKDCKVCETVAVGQIVPGNYYPSGGYGYSGPSGSYEGHSIDSYASPETAMPGDYTPAPVHIAPGTYIPPPPITTNAQHVPVVPAPPVVAPTYTAPPPAIAPRSPAPAPRPHLSAHAAPVTTPGVAPHTNASHSTLPDMLHWAAVLAAGAVLFQLFTLGLRPLRRYLALRHFRRPYWDETIDQRVSNAWQLALVGLRDAGFRPNGNEQPSALARRVPVAGLDRCAVILDRARHGVGLDKDDLATITSSASEAYTAARANLGAVSRATTWLRWPLV